MKQSAAMNPRVALSTLATWVRGGRGADGGLGSKLRDGKKDVYSELAARRRMAPQAAAGRTGGPGSMKTYFRTAARLPYVTPTKACGGRGGGAAVVSREGDGGALTRSDSAACNSHAPNCSCRRHSGRRQGTSWARAVARENRHVKAHSGKKAERKQTCVPYSI